MLRGERVGQRSADSDDGRVVQRKFTGDSADSVGAEESSHERTLASAAD